MKVFNVRVYHYDGTGNVVLKKEDWNKVIEALEASNIVLNQDDKHVTLMLEEGE